MHVDLNKYYKCKIEKEVLIKLIKKSDLKGSVHVAIFFTLLFVTGYLAFHTWGTWWSLFWFLIYGNIYNFSNAMWHETGHRTAFKTKLLNDIFYYISSYMAFFEPIRWRLLILIIMEIHIQLIILMIMKLNSIIIYKKHLLDCYTI